MPPEARRWRGVERHSGMETSRQLDGRWRCTATTDHGVGVSGNGGDYATPVHDHVDDVGGSDVL